MASSRHTLFYDSFAVHELTERKADGARLEGEMWGEEVDEWKQLDVGVR